MTSRSRTMVQLFAALILGVGFSLGKLAYVCRDPMSEACVWGKAYLPLNLPIEALASGAVIFVVLRIITRRRTQ